MSLPHSDSPESIRTVLMRTSEEFKEIYDDQRLVTEVLVNEALDKIIGPNRERLREADERYRLHDLLPAMLLHAPHPLGQRYVAVCLHVSHQKGEDSIINAAREWLDNLLLPMLASSKARKTQPSSSQTPIEREADPSLRAKVSHREQYRCAITKSFDRARAEKLEREERSDEIPEGAQHTMQVSHIIPSLLSNFDDDISEITNTGFTWDLLRSWTQIDSTTLVGPDIDSPANAIYMTTEEHLGFGHFRFYLDKEAYPEIPNKYRVRMPRSAMRLHNGLREVDVEFPTLEESTVVPPNPSYLKVHAAFAKVLHLCGAAQYIERVERDAEIEGTLHLNGETDFASYLRSKIAY